MRTSWLALVIASWLAVVGWPASAAAGPCTCREAPIEQVVYTADVIFVGTVTGIEAPGRPGAAGDAATAGGASADAAARARVSLRVFEVAKGDVKDAITLHTTAFSDPDCLGYDFAVGASYLVFASAEHSRSHEPRSYGVNTCAGTRPVAAASAPESLEAIARVVREQAVAVERPHVGVYPPEVVTQTAPQWPVDAELKSGTVDVNLIVTVNASGRAARVRVTRAVAGFEQAAIDCVRQWDYRSALANGVAVPSSLTVTVHFSR